MGIFSGIFNRWALSSQRKELQEFIDNLSSMDGAEIGFLVASATHLRQGLEETGFRLMDPMVDIANAPDTPLRLSRLIRDFQQNGDSGDAAAAMVWLHTMRVGARHELRAQAREMWRQLERGFPHAELAAIEIMRMTLKPVRIQDYDQFPAGLSPNPQP